MNCVQYINCEHVFCHIHTMQCIHSHISFTQVVVYLVLFVCLFVVYSVYLTLISVTVYIMQLHKFNTFALLCCMELPGDCAVTRGVSMSV